MSKDKKPSKGKAAAPEVQRGTQDELEVLALIIRENPFLKNSVLERLRQMKATAVRKNGPAIGVSAKDDAERK